MVDMVVVFGALVNLTVALEISQSMAVHMAEAETDFARQAYASTGLVFSICAYGVFWLVSMILVSPLASLLFGSEQWVSVLKVGITALAFNGVFTLLQDLLRWRLAPGAYLLASMAYAFGNVGVGIYLVAVTGAGVAGVLWGQVMGAIAGAVVSWYCLADFVSISMDLTRLREMLRYSAPLVVSGIAVFANQFIDRIAVKEMLGIDSLGVYGVAARFASAIGLGTIALQAALTPLIYHRSQDVRTPAELARIFRYYCAAMAPVVGVLALFSPEVIAVFSDQSYREAKDILPVLAVASLLTTLYVFAPGILLKKRTGVFAAINMASAGMNLILNLILVPILGILGAALTTCFTAAIAFIGFMMSSQQVYPVPHTWTRIRNAAMIALIIIVFSVWLSNNSRVLQSEILVVKSLLICGAILTSLLTVLSQEDRQSAWRWFSTVRLHSFGDRSL